MNPGTGPARPPFDSEDARAIAALIADPGAEGSRPGDRAFKVAMRSFAFDDLHFQRAKRAALAAGALSGQRIERLRRQARELIAVMDHPPAGALYRRAQRLGRTLRSRPRRRRIHVRRALAAALRAAAARAS